MALVLLGGTALSLSFVIGHGIYAPLRRARRTTHLEELREIVAMAMVGQISSTDAARRLAVASERDLIRIFVDLGRTLAGSSAIRLHEIASTLGLVARAESRCRSRSPTRRLQAVRLLLVIGGGHDGVPALLEDPAPEVRRVAARWIAKHGPAEGIGRLLRAADTPSALDDVTLVNSLDLAGRRNVESLVRYLLEPGAGLVPVLKASQGVAHPQLLPPVLALAHHTSPPVRREVARVLGVVGTVEALRRLHELLMDDDATVRRSAVDALAMIMDWRNASVVAGRIVDEDDHVRRSAALALRRFGSPGILLLRRAARTDQEHIRRAAQHVLDLPDTLDYGGIP